MTYTYDEILNAIKNGTDPAEIAQAFTKDLNDAIRAADEPSKFEVACCDFAEKWHDVLDAYALETGESIDDDLYFTGDDVKQVLPSIIKVYKLTQDYLNGVKNLASVYSNTGADAERSAASETFESLINDLIGK